MESDQAGRFEAGLEETGKRNRRRLDRRVEGSEVQIEKASAVCPLGKSRARGILGPAVEFWVGSGCGFQRERAALHCSAKRPDGTGGTWRGPYRCCGAGGPAVPSTLLGEHGKELVVEIGRQESRLRNVM